MTPQEQQIWDLVHDWCNAQYHDIPDQNRRVLMDRIYKLINKETMDYQKLFNYMSEEHGLILLENEMIEIIMIVNEMQNPKPKCGNNKPPCNPNTKFGILECMDCDWSE